MKRKKKFSKAHVILSWILQHDIIYVTDYFGIRFGLFPVAHLQMKANVTLEVGYLGLMTWVKWVVN